MTVTKIMNAKAFQEMKDSPNYSVVDFFAEWCGPCKYISPYFATLSDSEEFSSIQFFQVDVDELSEVSETEGIEAMPTFKVYKNGKLVETIVGANQTVLLNMLKKFLK